MLPKDRLPGAVRRLALGLLTAVTLALTPGFAAAPQTYLFLVFSDPTPGHEAEYNRWYNTEHGPDVTSIPGFVSGQRYIYADHQLRAVALKKPRYLIIYKVVTSSIPAVRAEIERRAKNGQTRMSPTISNVKMYTYRCSGPR